MKKQQVKNKKYRILSIDGGGIKGVFTAYAIMQLEIEYNIKILDYFDMVVGTSTGSLICASLLIGKSSKEIYETYINEELHPIFKKKQSISIRIVKPFFPKYSDDGLNNEIKNEFQNMKLSDLYRRSNNKTFAFFTTNFSKAKPIIYGSQNLNFLNNEHKDPTLFEALRSSSAAPLYFEPIKNISNHVLVDGGLWANNPSAYAINLAMSNFGFKLDEIEVLSFGQTFVEDADFQIKKGFDLIKDPSGNDISQLISSMIILNQNAQSYSATILLKDKYFRYSPEKIIPNVYIDKISPEFIKYSKIYWEENKNFLIKFILEGKNSKYNEEKEKMYN